MTDPTIDPAATSEDETSPDIAADDAGASAAIERMGKQATVDPDQDQDVDAPSDTEVS